jgi:hypothetical protein
MCPIRVSVTFLVVNKPSLQTSEKSPRYMADDTLPGRVLFCLLDGENAFFQVKAHFNNLVIDLKRLVHDEKRVALKGVDANQLKLFKVSSFYCQPECRPNYSS